MEEDCFRIKKEKKPNNFVIIKKRTKMEKHFKYNIIFNHLLYIVFFLD